MTNSTTLKTANLGSQKPTPTPLYHTLRYACYNQNMNTNHEQSNTAPEGSTETKWSDLESLAKNGPSGSVQEQVNLTQGYSETNKLLLPASSEVNQNIVETQRDHNWSLGRKVLSIAGVIKEAITNKAKQIVGKEMIGRSYFFDRYDSNIQYIKQHTEDEESFNPTEVYQDLMHDFPELRNVKLVSFIGINSFAIHHLKENNEDAPTILFNFGPNTFIVQQPEQSKKFKDLPYSQQEELLKNNFYDYDLDILVPKPKSEKDTNVAGMLKAVSEKMGKSPHELLQNKRLMSTFVFVHEFGHQLDFRRNYLNPRLEQQIKEKGKIYDRWQAVHDARAASDRERQNDGYDKITEDGRKNFGHNAQEHFTRKAELYRSRHSESVADTVAIDFIIKYADKYNFFNQDSKPISENYNQNYQEMQAQKHNAELSEAEWTKLRQNLEHDTWSASVLASLYGANDELFDSAYMYAGAQNNPNELKTSADNFLRNGLKYTRQCVWNKQKFGEHFGTNDTSGYDAKPDLKSTLEALAGYNDWRQTNQAENKDYQGDKQQDIEVKRDNVISKMVLEDFSIISDLIDGQPRSREEIQRRYQQLSADYKNRKMDNQADRLDKLFQAYSSINAVQPI